MQGDGGRERKKKKTTIEGTKRSLMKEKKQNGVSSLKEIREEWLEVKK